ncbi:MAG: TetR/AcrR family transcriptional regulator [Chitinophagales bacterium]|nr:TetR/AcrR family transcriptional regulator [Chitinophagales bacterium]
MAKEQLDNNTENRIKNAARAVFYRKGFAATKTRDIAEEAGINVALLNYYFRSKEKLFNIIMLETLLAFFQSMAAVVRDEETTLEEKIERMVDRYIDVLVNEPTIPVFIMSELRNNPDELLAQLNIRQMMSGAALFRQLEDYMRENNRKPVPPVYFIINLLGLVAFPFIASPIVRHMGNLSQEQFNHMMIERKQLIPVWIKAILNS